MQNSPHTHLKIQASIIEQLLLQARAARPFEIVGMLIGQQQNQQILPLENIASDPTREFTADPESVLHALKHIRTQGLELIALYHSHPNGPDHPSKTDFLESKWDVPMLILDAKNQTLRAWELENGTEIPIIITSSHLGLSK